MGTPPRPSQRERTIKVVLLLALVVACALLLMYLSVSTNPDYR